MSDNVTITCPTSTSNTIWTVTADSQIGVTGSPIAFTAVPILISALPATSVNSSFVSTTSCGQLPAGYTPIVYFVNQSPINGYPGTSVRDANGLLTDTTVGTVLSSLNISTCISYNTNSPISFTKDDVSNCNSQNYKFMIGIQNEYAYYNALYQYAMNRFISTYISPLGTDTVAIRDNKVAVYQTAAATLNKMVNDVIYIMDRIAQKRISGDLPVLTTQLNMLDSSLSARSIQLKAQRDILAGGKDSNNMVLQKEMEAYSRQKAQYHNNMLALYSFLNITALGLLFYVYRSM